MEAIPYFHQLLLQAAAKAEQILIQMLETGEVVVEEGLLIAPTTEEPGFLGRGSGVEMLLLHLHHIQQRVVVAQARLEETPSMRPLLELAEQVILTQQEQVSLD
jgi:hypothetical protein